MTGRIILSLVVFILNGAYTSISMAGGIDFKVLWKSPQLTEDRAIYLLAADLNGNRVKEIIVADFGAYDLPKHPSIVVVEYDGNTFQTRWEKEWEDPYAERKISGTLRRPLEPRVWNILGRTVVEIPPPFFMLEWREGKYIFHEQYEERFSEPTERWIWNWKEKDEVLAIADLDNDGKDEIVTFEWFKADSLEGIIRVRRMAPGFPVIWNSPPTKVFRSIAITGRFSQGGRKEVYAPPILLSNTGAGQYKIEIIPPEPMDTWSLKYSSVGHTLQKDKDEVWLPNRFGERERLRRFTLNQIRTAFIEENIYIEPHTDFLFVGHFDLGDLDGDGLDEVVVAEYTGRLGPEDPEGGRDVLNPKDYLHVLKWDGSKYRSVWISEPYVARRVGRIRVDDVTGDGKPEIVVAVEGGTLHIYQKK